MSLDATREAETPVAVYQTAADAPDPVGEPKTTVIITAFNYGHFLRDCIESVLGQSRPADQVIVVDDGSVDDSGAVLAEYEERLEIIRTLNAGQAAAFNLGFRRASGDVIFFLDADDLLRAEAIEVVLAHWSPDFALLAFGLETIDANGRSTGLHTFSVNANDGDNRPRLIRSGSLKGPFTFAPTSGNAFGRRFLEAALPMPEAEWRICADGYLVRAAALFGPVRALRRVLGGYRVHGGNNYMRTDTFDPWTMRRGLRDLEVSARALEALAACPQLERRDPEGATLRLALRLRALETWASIAAWTGDFGTFARRVRQSAAATLADGLPLGERLTAACSTVRYGLAVRRTKKLADPSQNESGVSPRPLTRLPGTSRLEAKLRQLERPRHLEAIPYGTPLRFVERGIQLNMLADGWSGEIRSGRCWSLGAGAALEFLLDPAPGPISIELGLAVPAELQGAGLRFCIDAPQGRLWAGDIRERATVRFDVDRDAYTPQAALRLEITAAAIEPRRWLRPRARPSFGLEHLRAEPRPAAQADPFLQPGQRVGIGELLSADPTRTDWLIEADGSATMQRPEAGLRLSVGPGPTQFDLVLVPRPGAPKGWLRIRCSGLDIFTGETGAGGALRIPLPDGADDAAARIELSLAFTSLDPASDEPFGVSEIGLVARAAAQDPHAILRYRGRAGPPLNLGQIVYLATNPGAQGFLRSGWDEVDSNGVRNLAAEASLAFTVPERAEDLVLRLALRPVLPPAAGLHHVVGFSARGSMLQVIELVGAGELALPLPESCLEAGREIVLTLHSVFTREREDAAASPGIAHATLELSSFGLQGEMADAPAATPPAPEATYPRPAFLRLLEEAAAAMEAADALPSMLAIRTALAQTIRACDQRALETMATQPEGLRIIGRLGAATAGAPMGACEREIVEHAAALARASPELPDRLRVAMLAMLLVPAFKSPLAPGFVELPAILLRDPSIIAAYLGREPVFVDGSEAGAYVEYLERLLTSTDAVLARERPGCARYDLAVQVLTGLRNTKALFGRGNLIRQIRLRSRCIERLLTQAGARLGLPRRPRPGARSLRIGVLVRNVLPSPEGWALLGMYRHLDRARFEPVLITVEDPEDQLETGSRFAREVCLQGLSIDQAVAAIRDLDLDIFVLGAYVANWEKVAAIVAHRLARVQVNSCFNCPTTLGFESFDHAVAWGGTEGPDTQTQYTERMAWIDAPLQCCFDFADVPPPAPEPPSAVRGEIGASEAAVLLVCGAMAHKIQPDLMRAWTEILARAPGSRLVLYPFAPWWAMAYSPETFRASIDDHLARLGVAPERVLILPEQSPGDVRRILAACDIYLDSFPYSGATTVCEAFSCGLPVVALAGATLRERTGAAWVEAYGLPELVARSAEQYVEIAARLASDPAERGVIAARVARVLASDRPPHADSRGFGAAYSDALWRIALDSGLFPGLEAAPDDALAGSGQAVVGRSRSSAGASLAMLRPEAGQPAARPARVRPVQPVGSRRFVILGLGRTGSTLLCDILNRCDNAVVDFELFHETEIQCRSGVIDDAEAVRARDADPVGWLERYFRTVEKRNPDLVGFKLFAHQNNRALRHVIGDERYRLVLLVRSNVLAQYSSRRIAEKTGEWAVLRGRNPTALRIPFDPADFEDFERTTLMFRNRLIETLSEFGRDALFVEYKSLQKRRTIRRLSAFLGVRIPINEATNLRKQNPGQIVERFTDPERVRAYLAARNLTDWANRG